MILTIDTSVAVKWIIDEPGSANALAYIASFQDLEGGIIEHTFLAPSLIALEMHNTIAKRLRRRQATFDQLAEAQFALQYIGIIDAVDDDLIDKARKMSFFAKHWSASIEGRPRPELGAVFNIYDCIFIAHAQRHRSTLLTADKEQAQMARVFDVPVEFVAAEAS